MRRALRALMVVVMVGGLAAGCSAEGGIGTEGDGIQIEGDVDAEE